MAGTVRLKHIMRENDWTFYFYDGTAEVKDGVIELPDDNFTLLRRAYLLGFRLTADGQPITSGSFEDIVAQASTESLEEHNESPSRGRQPSTNNRVRKSESPSSGDATSSGS